MPDWTNPQDQITPHFSISDALMLHEWNRLATEADGADFDKLTVLCQKLEQVRAILGCPLNIHCMFRSTAYNLAQGILPPTGLDVHALNEACDFDAGNNLSIQQVKDALEPQLEQLGIRMEKGTTSWIHVDLRTPGPSGRYFTP
jgi:Peptidase M15